MDKKLIFFLALLFSINVFSQNIPQVPELVTLDKIRLKINEDARNEIQIEVDALHANAKYFNAIIDKINIYFPVIEKILEEENVPKDFKYLSLQESSLIPDAVSSSNAVGFWQFKSTTAKTYGLNINNLVDERRNVVSSTRAAAKYLKNSNFVFDNWIFSLLSYMTGLTGAKSILDEKFYGSKRMEINKNTHWYIKRFLAHKIAYQDEINKENYNDNFTIYTNYEAKNIEDLSESLSVNLNDLKFYNKWLISSELPRDKVYSFLVPLKSKNLYSQIKSSVISKVKSFISSSKNSLIDEISTSRNEPNWLKEYRRDSLGIYHELPQEVSPLYSKYTDAKKMNPEQVSLSINTNSGIPEFLKKRIEEVKNQTSIIYNK